MKKQITIIILIVATLVVVSGCGKKNQNDAKLEVVNKQSQDQTREQSNQATTSSGVVDVSDWKTYKNDEYGFRFQYPADLEEAENHYYLFDLINNQSTIHISILDEAFDIDNVKSPIGYVPKDTISKKTVNGVEVYYFSDGDMGVGGNSYRIPLDINHTLLIWFVTESGYYKDENKIINSLNFTK